MSETPVSPTPSEVVTTSTPAPHPDVRPLKPNIKADELLELYEAEEASTNVSDDSSSGGAPHRHRASESPRTATPATSSAPAVGATNKTAPLTDSAEVDATKPTTDTTANPENPPAQAPTGIKARAGETEVEIPPDAVVHWEVNGKQVPFKVEDAFRAAATQEAFNRTADQRLSKIAAREQKYEQQNSQTIEGFNKIIEAAGNHDMFALARVMTELTKGDYAEVERKMLENVDRVYAEWSKMTPEQRNVFHAERRAEELSKKLKAKDEALADTATRERIGAEIKELCKPKGLTEEQYFHIYHDMVTSGMESTENPIQPQDVINYYEVIVLTDRVYKQLAQIDEKLLANNEFISDIIGNIRSYPNVTDEQIKKVLEDRIGTRRSIENLNSKVQTNQTNGFGGGAQVNQANSKEKEAKAEEDEIYDFFFHRRSTR